jgi:hypothetical protein
MRKATPSEFNSREGSQVRVKSIFAAMVLAATLTAGLSATASAQSNMDPQQMGTKEQRQACGADVGRYCKKVKPEDGPMAYLACLQTNRDKLHPACKAMLAGVGQ